MIGGTKMYHRFC